MRTIILLHIHLHTYTYIHTKPTVYYIYTYSHIQNFVNLGPVLSLAPDDLSPEMLTQLSIPLEMLTIGKVEEALSNLTKAIKGLGIV